MRRFLLLLVLVFLSACTRPESGQLSLPEQQSVPLEEQKAGLVIDFGDDVSSSSAVLGEQDNALGILLTQLDQLGTTYAVQEYDFGSLVTAIGDYENSDKQAWIYFVNGQAGDVAADKKLVKSGDVVEWKFIEPIY